jgi:hypothetical protein
MRRVCYEGEGLRVEVNEESVWNKGEELKTEGTEECV